MPTFTMRCAYCHNDYEAYRSTSRFCTDAHRVAFNRAAEARRIARIADLLRQTSAAIADGAPSGVLHGLARDADLLLARRETHESV